jgi:hypothetical protein
MKMRVTMIADLSLIPSLVTGVALGKIDAESLDIQPVFANGRERLKPATKRGVRRPKKRKVGRPKLHLPDRIVGAVRQLQDSAVGATLKNIKREVKSPSVSPAITDLIKQKKITRTKPGYYRVGVS